MPWSKLRAASVVAVLGLAGASLGACASTDTEERLAAMDSRLTAIETRSAEVGQRTDAAARTAEQASANNATRIEQLESRVTRLEQMPPPRTPRN